MDTAADVVAVKRCQYPLLDVSALPLSALTTGGSAALARSVQQVIDSLDDPDGVISAFQSYTSQS